MHVSRPSKMVVLPKRYNTMLYETKNKGLAQMKRIMTHMSQATEASFSKTCFLGWKEVVREAVDHRKEKNFKNAVAEMESHKKNEALQKAVQMMGLQDENRDGNSPHCCMLTRVIGTSHKHHDNHC